MTRAQILAVIGYLCGMGYAATIPHDAVLFGACLAGLMTTLGISSVFQSPPVVTK